MVERLKEVHRKHQDWRDLSEKIGGLRGYVEGIGRGSSGLSDCATASISVRINSIPSPPSLKSAGDMQLMLQVGRIFIFDHNM